MPSSASAYSAQPPALTWTPSTIGAGSPDTVRSSGSNGTAQSEASRPNTQMPRARHRPIGPLDQGLLRTGVQRQDRHLEVVKVLLQVPNGVKHRLTTWHKGWHP